MLTRELFAVANLLVSLCISNPHQRWMC